MQPVSIQSNVTFFIYFSLVVCFGRWGDICSLVGLHEVIPFGNFVSCDDDTPVCKVLSAEELADQQNPEEDVEAEDDADDLEPLPPVSAAEGMSALGTLRRFLYQQEQVPENIFEVCHRLENLLLSSCKKKQTKIDDFFSKQ